MPEDKYSLDNYDLSSAWDADRFSNLGLGTGTNSGRRFSLYGPKEGGFMDGLGSNLNLGDTTGDTTGGSFMDGLNLQGFSTGVGLAFSTYSDYMQGKYQNKLMDIMDANLAMTQKADDTHYKNAAGFDNYSSSRTA